MILASDKTQLSTFSGDKQAWPVYLTIGNIDKDVRRKPSRRAVVLLGYLPVTKLHCFRESDRALQGYRVFHYAMRQMLAPLIDAGRTGVWMTCADGYVRHVFPLLAAYIADHPEQCLVCCTKENRCPTCLVERDKRGDLLTSCYRDPDATKAALQDPESDVFKDAGLRNIPQPFWADLPYANIFNCIVPDLLHQLHKGVFMTHLVKWVSTGCEDELDARFARVPPYPGLRIFSKGISTISQWTGNEYRQMEKVFIGLIDGLHEDPRVMAAARAILDFIYLAHYPSHSVSTLEQMRAALDAFHANKQVFVDKAIRTHFNIPKLHWMIHYISSIIDFGSCDGLSTEISERLHIDFAKLAYRASNRKEYIKQMITWLTRREKVRWFQGFLRWCRPGRADGAQEMETQSHTGDDADDEKCDSDSAPGSIVALTLSADSALTTLSPSHKPTATGSAPTSSPLPSQHALTTPTPFCQSSCSVRIIDASAIGTSSGRSNETEEDGEGGDTNLDDADTNDDLVSCYYPRPSLTYLLTFPCVVHAGLIVRTVCDRTQARPRLPFWSRHCLQPWRI